MSDEADATIQANMNTAAPSAELLEQIRQLRAGLERQQQEMERMRTALRMPQSVAQHAGVNDSVRQPIDCSKQKQLIVDSEVHEPIEKEQHTTPSSRPRTYCRSDSDDERYREAKLFSAINKGKLCKVQELLSSGVKTDIVDKNNKHNSPLHYAVVKGHEEIVKELLLPNWNTNINTRNNEGDTPLHIATSKQNKDLVQLLLNKHAEVNIENNAGQIPIELSNDQQIIDALNQQSRVEASSSHHCNSRRRSLPNQQQQQKRTIDRESSNSKKSKFLTNIEVEKSRRVKRLYIDASESEAGRVKKVRISEEYVASGLKSSLHGVIYQLKLLMVVLKRGLDKEYSFRLATEMDAAEKFDDLVFQYMEGDKKVYRFLQAKHKQDVSKKIALHDLLTETDGEFSLSKYFTSYRKIKENPQFNGHNDEIKDFIICTNIDFKFGDKRGDLTLSHDIFEKETNKDGREKIDDILKTRLIRFRDNFDGKKQIVSILKNTSDLSKLVTILAECLLDGKLISPDNSKNDSKGNLFRSYQCALIKEVIDNGSHKLKANFIDAVSLSPEAENFRIAFENFFELRRKSFNFEDNPCIKEEDMDNFAHEIAKHIIKGRASKIVKIERRSKAIRNNFDKLAGYVLVKNDGQIQLSCAFLNNSQLPGNLEDFRAKLKKKLSKEAGLFQNLHQYQFRVSDFKTCEEIYVDRNTFWSTIKEKKFKLFDNFGKIDTNLESIEKFAEKMVALIEESECNEEKIVKIQRKDNIISKNIDKLIQHVLIEKDGKIQFSSEFLSNTDLPGNLNDFRDKLKSRFNDLREYHFHISNFPKLNLPNDSMSNIENDIKCFLSHLVFAVNQPNEVELGNIIEAEMSADKDINFIDSDFIASKFQREILDWMKEKKGRFLTHQDGQHFFAEVRKKLAKLVLTWPTLEYRDKIKGLGITFRDAQTKLRNFLSDSSAKQIFNLISPQNTTLGLIKVYQLLKDDDAKDDSYIFISLGSLLRRQDRVLQALSLPSDSNTLMVIKCEPINGNVQRLIDQLFRMITSDKKIILITEESDDALASKFKDCFSDKYEEEIADQIGLIDLTPESQNKILRRGTFIFQGESVTPSTLIRHELKHLVNAEVLSKLISNEEIQVGQPLADLGNVKNYYIPRTFNRLVQFGKYLIQNTDHFFFVSETKTDMSDLQQHQDIVLISDTGSNFEELCNIYEGRNIHWLREKHRVLIWQRSHGTLSKLREFIHQRMHKISLFKLEKITDIPEKLVIIAAEPGMGKSSVLTNLSIKAKKSDPALWVAKINLVVDCATELDNLVVSEMEFNKEKVIEFLERSMKLTTNLEKELFKDCYNRGKVALFFDGYDEINPEYGKKFIAFVRLLKSSKVEKLYITTRPYNIQKDLEDTLGTFSYALDKFSKDDQKRFLRKFWKKVFGLDVLDYGRSRMFIDELLHSFSQSIKDQERKFISIPQQIEMIAVIFKDTFEEFYESDNAHLSEKHKQKINDALDLITLYEKFFKKKFDEILFGEKAPGINWADPKMKGILNGERKRIIEDHKKLAMCSLFGRDELKILLAGELESVTGDGESLIRYIEHGKEKLGIIDRVVNNKPVFVHQTFAEYFAALWLAENWRRQGVRNVLKGNIFEQRNEVMRNFFDHMLCTDKHDRGTYEIHTAVLKNDELKVADVLKRNGSIVNTTDKAGRTPLHLAAAYDYKVITASLLKVAQQLESAEMVNIRDELFGWSSLSYADKSGHWNVAELILQNGGNDDDMFEAISRINDGVVNERAETLLHIAAKEGHVKFVQVLIGKKMNINAIDRDGMTPLHLSAQRGQLNVVKYLVDNEKVDFNIRDKNERIPLFVAAEEGQLEIVKYFVEEKKMDVGIKGEYRTVSLHSAAKNGHLGTVEYLVHKGSEFNIINTIGTHGGTPLHLAAQYGQLEIVKYLLKNGAEFDIVDDSTPLHWAALYGKLDVVKYLVDEENVNIEAREYDGSTPLHLAAQNGHLELVEWLILKHANLDARDHNARIPLHLAAECGKLKVVQCLITEKENDLEVKDKDGNTPLHLTARFPDVAKYLIEQKNANFDTKNKSGQTLLHKAAMADNALDVVEYLVEERKVHFTSADDEGSTPLHLAARYGRLDVVNYFLGKIEDEFEKLNALLFDTKKYGMTPLHYALLNDHIDIMNTLLRNMKNHQKNLKELVYGQETEVDNLDCDNDSIVQLLLEKGADAFMENKHHTILHEAVRGDMTVTLQLLLNKIKEKNGNHINSPDVEGNTPLMWAAINNKPNAADVLLGYGASVDAENGDEKTVLHLAVCNRHTHMVNLFIELVNNIDAKDKDDRTPLHWAAEEREWDILRILIQKGANVNAVDKNGRIVLHWAAADGNLDIVRFLAEHNADCNFKDKDGNTPLHLAADGGELDTIKYLIEVQKVRSNSSNNHGKTPLQLARQEGKLSTVSYLSRRDESNSTNIR